MSIRAKRTTVKNAYSILGAEFLFILLPFVVSGIVFSSKGEYLSLLQMPEWSLAAAVLFGQSLVKFISGILANKGTYRARWERVALGIAFLIVVGLVPCLIVLSLILMRGHPSLALSFVQIGIFAFGVAAFFIFGAGGETLLRSAELTPEQDAKMM